MIFQQSEIPRVPRHLDGKQQVKTWEAALTERDAKLRSLDAELIATRKRLDAAIAELKSAVER